jgi:hypothetical protein
LKNKSARWTAYSLELLITKTDCTTLKIQHENAAKANSDTVPMPPENHRAVLCVLKT